MCCELRWLHCFRANNYHHRNDWCDIVQMYAIVSILWCCCLAIIIVVVVIVIDIIHSFYTLTGRVQGFMFSFSFILHGNVLTMNVTKEFNLLHDFDKMERFFFVLSEWSMFTHFHRYLFMVWFRNGKVCANAPFDLVLEKKKTTRTWNMCQNHQTQS